MSDAQVTEDGSSDCKKSYNTERSGSSEIGKSKNWKEKG